MRELLRPILAPLLAPAKYLKMISRRTVFLVLALALAISTVITNLEQVQKINRAILAKSISNISDQAFRFIDSLPEGSIVLLSGDYSPSTKVECDPITISFLRQAFTKNLYVITIGLWPDGAQIVTDLTRAVAQQYNKIEDRDFVIGGYVVGTYVAMEKMATDIYQAIPQLKRSPAPFLKRVKTINDISLVFSVSAGDMLMYYIKITRSRYGVPVSGGCTAVVAPEMYPYILSGQLTGLFAGLKGAADYEILMFKRYDVPTGDAVKLMFTQSVIHFLIILFVLIGNIIFLHEIFSRP